ncbi:MAG: fatty acid desaturase family protein [Xenococcaceae cyanobacterium MO_188.B29]|nr:fatty acid desaturase family protein [Xenococcaceae cyanobacterium MO_188.B29]
MSIDSGKKMQEAIRNNLDSDLRAKDIGGQVLDRKKIIAEVRKLSKVSTFHSLLAILNHWIIVIAAASVAIWSGHWAVYLLAMIIIATRQHALAILVHDACHYRLFPNRIANDMITDILVGFHLGMSTSLYRKWHYPHHRYVNTDKDPEVMGEHKDPDTWKWPNTKLHMLKIFIKDALGFYSLTMARIMSLWSPWSRLHLPSKDAGGIPVREKVALILFAVTGISALVYFGLVIDYLLLWVLPSLTFFSILFKFRSFAEHKVVTNENELNNTRTVIPNWLERFLISPCNVNYHLEHHLFPSVPFYNLPKLHFLLMEDPVFQKEAQLSNSYLGLSTGVLGELTKVNEDVVSVGAP